MKSRYRLHGEGRMKPTAGVEPGELGRSRVSHPPASGSGALQRLVVDQDRYPVGSQHGIELDAATAESRCKTQAG